MVKLHITPQELQTLRQTDIFYVKRQFFDKLSQAFAAWQAEARQQSCWKDAWLPVEMDKTSGKISRGENYEGLPWMMADMPRHFGKEDVLAFRLFFWWGHYFSATWHLKGAPLKSWWPRLSHWLSTASPDMLVSWEGDEWNHTLSHPAYTNAADAAIWQDGAPHWLKITVKMEMDADWYTRSMEHFNSLLREVG